VLVYWGCGGGEPPGRRVHLTTYIGSNGILFNATAEGIRYYQTKEN
jgi:hypothetical protein